MIALNRTELEPDLEFGFKFGHLAVVVFKIEIIYPYNYSHNAVRNRITK